MPTLVPAAVAFFGATAATIGGYAITYGAIAKAVVLVGSVAYSQRQTAKLRKSLATNLDQGRTIMSRDPIAPRRLIYGQVLVSGPIVFMHATGAKQEYLHMVVILAGHEVEEIGDIYFNDEVVPLSAGEATGKYAGFARITKRLGTAAEAADANLISETGGIWTSAHKNEGCAALVIRLKWSPELFPNGLPNIKALVKGKKCHDWRTGITQYTNNSAVCAADYLANSTFGKGVALARIRSADAIEAANICDEDVILATTVAAGAFVIGSTYSIASVGSTDFTLIGASGNTIGVVFTATGEGSGTGTADDTEKRYATNGTINSDFEPTEVLRDLAGAMAGSIIDTGGTWTVRAGAYRSSTATLTDSDLIGPFSVQPRQSRSETFNRVRGLYVSPQNQWAPADFPAVSNTTYKAADGGIWLDRDVQYNFTTSPAMAQRLAKIELERGRQQITCSGVYTLKAMQFMPGDTCAITRDRLGWTAKEFEIAEWQDANNGDGVQLSLRETAAGVWDWNDGEETTVDLAPNTTLPDPFTVPTPAAPTLTSASTMQEDGTVEPRFTVEWLTPDNIHVEQGGFVAVEYKVQADSDWLEWSQTRGDLLADMIGGVVVGEIYDVRIRFINNAGVRGAYSTTASVTVLGDVTAPATPTGLAAIVGTGKMVSLDWDDNTEADLGEYGIYRHTSDISGSSTLIAEVSASRFVDVDVTVGTPYYYWITAIDRSENESAKTASVTATPTAAGAGIDTTPPSDPTAPTLGANISYAASDGSARSIVVVNVPAMPSGAVILNVLYRRDGHGEGWLIAEQRNTGSGAVQMDDLTPGYVYQYAVQAFSAYGYGSAVVTGASTFTAASDTTAPTAPSSLTAVTGTGKSVSLDWADNTEADFSEYAIYRHTSNVSGSATKLAETRASRFVDVDVALGTAYYYWVKAIDRTENTSAFSTGVGPVTPGKVAATDADATAPSTPSAASKTAEGTYTAGDGTVYSYLEISVPALPTLGKYQNLLYKKASGGGDWLVAAQLTNTGTQAVRIDDLSPGTSYDVATQAFSAFAIPSAVTTATSSPFTAPNKTGAPTAPSGASVSANALTNLSWSSSSIWFAGRAQWAVNTDSDFSHFEVKNTTTDSDGATDYIWEPTGVTKRYEAFVDLYKATPANGHVRVRSVNRSGVASAWTYVGNIVTAATAQGGNMALQNASSVAVTGGAISGITDIALADGGTGSSTAAGARTNLGLGTVATQSDTDVAVTGLKTGGTGARKVIARYQETAVYTLAGGATSEDESVSISGRGFTTKPDIGSVQVASDDNVGCYYNFDNGSNSSSSAWIKFHTYDGTNITAGNYRVSIEFVEYD